MSDRGHWLALLLSLTLVRGLIYAAIIPPWQAPDENGHFEYAWLIAHLGRLPSPEDASMTFEQELLASLYEWRYGEFIGRALPDRMPSRIEDLPSSVLAARCRVVLWGRFSPAYVWQVLFLLPFRHQDFIFQLYAARLSSVLLNVAIVWLASRIFSELLSSRRRIVFLMTAVVAFWPQHTYINSMVGDGPLAELLACLTLYFWVRGFGKGFGLLEIVGIVFGTLGAVSSKATAGFLIPLDIGLFVWWLLRRSRQGWSKRQMLSLFICLVLLGVGSWMWSDSLSGTRILGALRTLQRIFSPSEWLWEDEGSTSFLQALLGAYDSFWANFGWMSLPLSERWYGAILLLSLGALIGWVLGRPVGRTPSWALGVMIGAFILASGVFVWIQILIGLSGHYQNQGRYLFPVSVPYVFLLVSGLERLFSIHERRYVVMLGLFLLLLDAWCLAGYVLPRFYSQGGP